jgi:predicted RNA binding protein YcfA (HicA-like mRNA interferase family)
MAKKDKLIEKAMRKGKTMKGTELRKVAEAYGWYRDPQQGNATSHKHWIHDEYDHKVTIMARDHRPKEVEGVLKQLRIID